MPAGFGRPWGIPAALSRRTLTAPAGASYAQVAVGAFMTATEASMPTDYCLRIALDENTRLPNLWRGPTRLANPDWLHLCLAGVSWFDPLCQPLVARSNLAHLHPCLRVVHCLGAEQDFFGACSKAAGQ